MAVSTPIVFFFRCSCVDITECACCGSQSVSCVGLGVRTITIACVSVYVLVLFLFCKRNRTHLRAAHKSHSDSGGGENLTTTVGLVKVRAQSCCRGTEEIKIPRQTPTLGKYEPSLVGGTEEIKIPEANSHIFGGSGVGSFEKILPHLRRRQPIY